MFFRTRINKKRKKQRFLQAVSLALLFSFAISSFPHSVSANTVFPEGSLWRATDDSRVYIIAKQRKRHIATEAVFNSYGLRFADVSLISLAALNGLPNARAIKMAESAAVFNITTGQVVAILSATEFLQNGFTWDEIVTVNKTEFASYLPAVVEESPAVAVSVAPAGHPLLEKIKTARLLLHEAAPIYAQEKRVASTRSLSAGATGTDVELIQQTLQRLGYFPKTVVANGVFGPQTRTSVLAFQKAEGLEQVGSIGSQTRAALERRGLVAANSTLVGDWRDVVPADREVLLAAWNEQRDVIDLIRVTLTTERVMVGSKFRTVPKAVSRTSGFTVRYDSGNGVNVQYSVTAPAGYLVLANRFPIFNASPGSLGTFPPTEEVYIPYNAAFLDPVIVAAGRAYLDEVVTKALAELRQQGLRSSSGNGLVADRIDPTLLKAIALIEHIDMAGFTRATNKDAVVNKVFAILATNREGSYRFAGSSAGALGLAQFMRRTYESTVRRYPAAKLIPDFRAGMADHVNAFKAMALYHDESNATLESHARKHLQSDADFSSLMAEVLAAAYNGGAGRVRMALKKFGNDWQVAVSSYGLRTETKSYLEKFRAVVHWLAVS